MARNSEKAMTALARWRIMQLKEQGKISTERRPILASMETDLKKGEKWRIQVIREIARKVAQIQNAGLGEFKIRDLNDEINKLLREKRHWEDRIVELGGRDWRKFGPKMIEREGIEAPGNRGYKYFGAARDLPGVRELFEQEPPPPPRKTRGELMKHLDAEYFGYMDDEDGRLIPAEIDAEKDLVQKKVTEWRASKEAVMRGEPKSVEEEEDDIEDIYKIEVPEKVEPPRVVENVPSQKDIEKALLEHKKRQLLAKYVSEDLMGEEAESKELMGK